MAHARGVHLELSLSPESLTIVGDADRVRQLLLVLIDNAIRYSREGGSVLLSARRAQSDSPAAEVLIKDRGIGIEPAELPRVFERGHRGQNAQQHCADGSGLGLPIARVLARGHGGDVEINSSTVDGTTAIVTLPLMTRQVERSA